MSCRQRRIQRLTSLLIRQVEEFEVATGGGFWVAIGARGAGWKVIKINGSFKYAKFARVAVNWIAAEPDGDNVISQELQRLLGSDLLEFNRPQRVMISAEGDADCWQISEV